MHRCVHVGDGSRFERVDEVDDVLRHHVASPQDARVLVQRVPQPGGAEQPHYLSTLASQIRLFLLVSLLLLHLR